MGRPGGHHVGSLVFVIALLHPVVLMAQPVPAMFRGQPAPSGEIDTRGLDRLGGVVWRFDAGSAVRSSPVVAEGVVYVGTSAGELHALDAASGAARWTTSVESAIGGAPLVTGTFVVCVDRANRIHAVDRLTGQKEWVVEGDPDLPLEWGLEGWDYILSSPVLADSLVVVGTGDGIVRAIHLASGKVHWQFETGGRIRSSAFVDDGVAYVGSGTGILHGLSVRDGSEVWRFETAGASWKSADWGFDRKQMYSSPTIREGVLYVGSRDAALYAIDVESRDTVWTFVDGTSWVVSSPAVAGGRVISARSGSLKIRSIDLESGDGEWSVTTGGYVFSSPRIVGSTVFVGSGDGKLYALDAATGEERWSYRTEGAIYSTPAIWDGRLYVGSDDGFVHALKSTDGPQPARAVYWDEDLRETAVWGGQDEHRRVADYFDDAGYEMLDAAALDSFLTVRLDDRVPSVIVAAMDAVPESVVSPSGQSSLLRRYLNVGGKVVWLGLPPLLLERNQDGQITGVSRDAPTALLGVSHASWNADEYPIAPTAEGRKWGLRSRWIGVGGIDPAEPVTVLATDEVGRSAMWVQSYGGPSGTGFVSVRMGYEDSYLEELKSVAEYGVMTPTGE
ncbi:MAG: PQQ-binding-like beta-propeller repeat protein [Rhodothermales bacterium]|nr:PQQ-binding-like beta-propeller repeat protein [Rhodothermales bacterium]